MLAGDGMDMYSTVTNGETLIWINPYILGSQNGLQASNLLLPPSLFPGRVGFFFHLFAPEKSPLSSVHGLSISFGIDRGG